MGFQELPRDRRGLDKEMTMNRSSPSVDLDIALRRIESRSRPLLICLRLLEQEPDRFERAAVRWLGRLLRSSRPRRRIASPANACVSSTAGADRVSARVPSSRGSGSHSAVAWPVTGGSAGDPTRVAVSSSKPANALASLGPAEVRTPSRLAALLPEPERRFPLLRAAEP
jgi:hypothetical protein